MEMRPFFGTFKQMSVVGVPVVNRFMEVSGVRFRNLSPLHCIACLPPQVGPPSPPPCSPLVTTAVCEVVFSLLNLFAFPLAPIPPL